MKRNVLYVLIFCLNDLNAVLVKVEKGWLKGEILEAVTGLTTYHSFKGIPYAKPPVGKLRFMAPEEPDSWDGVRNATEHGSVCPQYDIYTEVFEPGNEDCLYLNVYTGSLNETELKPVLVFIHGGGYKSGSGNVDFYSPDFLVDDGVIVVTINYRIDSLGFLCLDNAKVPGNAGLKDQVLALKWINKNIQNFGGNPNNITIMGQSAGGASVALHLISPMSKGLFQQAISMSGVPTCDFSLSYKATKRAYLLAKLLGNDTSDPDELLEFLQSVPSSYLVNVDVSLLSSEKLITDNILKSFYFTPVVEKNFGTEHFLLQDPEKAIKNGAVNKANILFGHTNEETITGITRFENSILNVTDRYGEAISTRKILYESDPETLLKISELIRQHYFGNNSINTTTMREFVTYANEAYFTAAIQKFFASFHEMEGVNKFFYIFSSFSNRNYFGSSGKRYNIYAAGHLDELMYLFNPNSLNMTITMDSDEYKMVNLTSKLFINYVKYGTPTPDDSLGIKWPVFNSTSLNYVEIANETLTIGSNPNGKAVKFWNQMLRLTEL